MAKVYVVTEGSYSDYHIVAIFSDKNNADIHAALLNSTESFYDEARVEEWNVDNVEIDTRQKIVHYATVQYCEGQITAVNILNGIDGLIKFDQPIRINDIRNAWVNIRADNIDKAKKIFYDKYAEALNDYLIEFRKNHSKED